MAGGTQRIWLVWAPGYQTFGTKCSDLSSYLWTNAAVQGREWFSWGPQFYEPSQLDEFTPVSRHH